MDTNTDAEYQQFCMLVITKFVIRTSGCAGTAGKSPETAVPQINSLLAAQLMVQHLYHGLSSSLMSHQVCLRIRYTTLATSCSLLERQQLSV